MNYFHLENPKFLNSWLLKLYIYCKHAYPWSSLHLCFRPMEVDYPVSAQGPHSQILMTGEGSDRGQYFIPQKITTSEFVYPKKSLLFLTYPKKIP